MTPNRKHTRTSTRAAQEYTVTELLDVICDLAHLVSDTAKALEQESPGLAEVGYWSTAQRTAYDRAKEILHNCNLCCPKDEE